MKSVRTLVFAGVMLFAIAAVVIGAYGLSNHYISAQKAANDSKFVTCKKLGIDHQVILQNNRANPDYVTGKLCDTMTFINRDSDTRLMAFGPHEDHQPYDGITEKVLEASQSFTITFNERGTYHFHDHIGDIVQGNFTVTK